NTPDNLHIGLASLNAASPPSSVRTASVPTSRADVHSAALRAILGDGSLTRPTQLNDQEMLNLVAADLAATSGSRDQPWRLRKGRKGAGGRKGRSLAPPHP